MISNFSDDPGSYGADFQSERPGIHTVMVTLDGIPVEGSPIEIVLGKPASSPTGGSPQPTTTRSVRSNPRKAWGTLGCPWDRYRERGRDSSNGFKMSQNSGNFMK